MIKLDLSEKDDYQLHHIVMYRNGRTLYEYLVEMPLEKLQAYPKKGYHWWMGRKAKSPQAMELRDYVLHWRMAALDFRSKYPKEYLRSLTVKELRAFINTYIEKTPAWAYEGPIRDALHILFERNELFIKQRFNSIT